jgi:hypothetical protein
LNEPTHPFGHSRVTPGCPWTECYLTSNHVSFSRPSRHPWMEGIESGSLFQLLISYSTSPPSYIESGEFRLRSSGRLDIQQDESWRPTNTADQAMKNLGRHRDIDNPMLRTPLLLDITPPTVTRISPHSLSLSQASHGGVEVVSLRDNYASHGVVTLFSKPHHNCPTWSRTSTERPSISKGGASQR